MGEGVGRGRHPVRMGQEFWRQVNEGSLGTGIYLSKILNMEWRRRVIPTGQLEGQGTLEKDPKCNDRLKD